jgi:hypothetical protein
LGISLNQCAPAMEGSPAGNEPGVLNRQFTQQLKDKDIEKNVIETTDSDIERENKLRENEPKDLVKGNLTYNPKFMLNKVIFEENTVFSDKKLQKIVKDKVGKEVYLEDVMKMTLDVSNFYRKKGYITSFAYLDSQEINDGVVKINITDENKDTFIGHIKIMGDYSLIQSSDKEGNYGFRYGLNKHLIQSNCDYRMTANGYEFLYVLKKDTVFNKIKDFAISNAIDIGKQLLVNFASANL